MRAFSSLAVAAVLIAGSSAAQAICRVPSVQYTGGAFGAAAVNATGCSNPATDGGTGSTSAMVIDAPAAGLQSSANIASGVLTAYSRNGFASAALWDTLTFSGLPGSGAMLTETLSLSGSMTGFASGYLDLQAGTPYASGSLQQGWSLSAGNFPKSVSLTFEAHNGVPIMVYSAIYANGSAGNVADLLDPPTFGITTPGGVTFTSASNVFQNVSPVPEPATWGMLIAGLAMFGAIRFKRRA